MKREISTIHGLDDFSMETQPSIRVGDTSRGENSRGGYHKKQSELSRNYISWNRVMDNHLARVLTDQMAQGNKCDGDTWKPQALQAAVTYLKIRCFFVDVLVLRLMTILEFGFDILAYENAISISYVCFVKKNVNILLNVYLYTCSCLFK